MKKILLSIVAVILSMGIASATLPVDLSVADRSIAKELMDRAKSIKKITPKYEISRDGEEDVVIEPGTALYDDQGLMYVVMDTAYKFTVVANFDYQHYDTPDIVIPAEIDVMGEVYTNVAIGPYCFHNAGSVFSVEIPETILGIGEFAFYACAHLSSIDIPDKCSYIGAFAFYFCTGLTEIALPEGITEIEGHTFADCSGLETVILPESLEKIGQNAFYHTNQVKEYHLGKNVKEIVYNPWGDAWETEGIYVDPENEVYCDIDGVVFTKDKKTLVAFPDGNTHNYVVPEGTEVIGEYAFYYSEFLESIKIPETVTTIRDAAFMYSNEMTTFELPASVVNIGSAVFYRATAIKNFVVADGNPNYKAISGVLYNKAGSVLVAFPGARTGSYKAVDGTYAVADYAFGGTNIEKVSLPESCELIGNAAFYSSKIVEVDMPGVTEIYDLAFYFCYYYENIIIPAKCKILYDGVYTDCPRVKTIRSYAPTAPRCGSNVFPALNGFDLSVLVGCGESYRRSSTFRMFVIREDLYRVTAEYDKELGSVNINGQGDIAYLNTADEMNVVIRAMRGCYVESVFVNDVDYTSELNNYDELTVPAAKENVVIKVNFKDNSGIEDIDVENAEVEYFNLNGARVNNPKQGGLYIKAEKTSRGTTYSKVVL